MRFWSGQSGRTGRNQTHDPRSGNPILPSAGNTDGRQTLHRRHRRVERRLYIRGARHPADTVPRPGYGSTSKSCLQYSPALPNTTSYHRKPIILINKRLLKL